MATTASNSLVYSTTPITSTTPGQVIQNLDLYVTGDQPAIAVTSDNVTIKNVRIHVTTGDGIDVWGNNATLSGIEVDGPTPKAGTPGNGNDGVYAYNVTGLKVDHLTVRDVGAGVNAVNSPGTALSYIEGYDMQGPYPTGQLVQFNASANSSLAHFYSLNNAATSTPEDVISVTSSQNVTISDGVIDGDNSPSGVGVMFEGDSSGGQVTNVDAVHMGDGAFSAYSDNITFTNVRSFDNTAKSQGRGAPMSGGVIFASTGANDKFINATYTRPANAGNILFGEPVTAQISQNASATVQSHISNMFSWSTAAGTTATVTPPPALGVAITSQVLAQDTGRSTSDNVTSNGAVTLSGTMAGPSGTIVKVVDGTTVLGTATLGTAGTWNYTTSLGSGTHAVKAIAVASDGTSLSSAAAATITVQTAAPTIALTSTVVASNGKSETLTGTVSGASGTTVALFNGTAQLGTAVLDGKGNWSYTAALAAGTYALTATATDLAGNAASVRPAFTVPAVAAQSTPVVQSTTAVQPKPAASSPANGLDTLSLSLSEDAYKGDAQFTLTVDGKQVGGVQTVTALQSLGKAQTFTFTGRFGTGSHNVGVAFLNDAYGGSASTDRNLHVNSITLNGKTTNENATQYSQGNRTYAVTGGSSSATSAVTVRNGATLILDKEAGARAAVSFQGASGQLQLTDAASFAGSISGFRAGDSIDLRSIVYGAGAVPQISYSGGRSSGTLAVSDGTNTAHLNLIGRSAHSNLVLASDNAGGTMITVG